MAKPAPVETKVEDLPPLQLLVRSKVETRTMFGPVETSEKSAVSPAHIRTPSRAASVFSNDGKLVAIAGPEDVVIYDVKSGDTVCTLAHPAVNMMAFSPLGTYLMTWRKRQGSEKNLGLWAVKDGSMAFGFIHVDIDKKTWPPVSWDAAESLMAGYTTNTVTVFSVPEFERVCKVSCKGVQRISLSPGGAEPLLAVFSPEQKGSPGRVHVYKVAPEAEPGSKPTVVAEKAVFSATHAEFKWAPNSSGLLFQTASETAKDSYYGESQLCYATAAGKVYSVALSKEGPVHDIAWTPNSTQFLVIGGKSPPCATLYNARTCEPSFEFGVGPYNTIRISPHGRFLVLGGFDNMAGRMAFWDLYKLKLMGENEVRVAVTSEWSPCGRYFLTTTLFPRLRVDNGYKIFKYTGAGPLLHEAFDTELYQVTWQPSQAGVYPNRPQSPRSADGAPAAAVVPKKRVVYRPPGSTGMVARMMAEARGGPKAGKVDKAKAARATGLPVGMSSEPDGKSAAARRRERRKKNMAEAKAAEAAKAVVAPPPVPPPAPKVSSLDDTAKEKRKLAKKLRQVDNLIERKAKGEKLNDEQLARVATVDELREALAKLG